MNDDIDLVERHAEEFVGLDHLETLVHQRRRVDRDLGPHRPCGMSQRIVDRDLLEVAAVAASKRSPTRREHDAMNSIGCADLAGNAVGPQTLVHRTVLAVDRNQLRTWGLPCSLDHRPGGDQRFLVGQAEPLARLEGREGTGSPAKPTTPLMTVSAVSARRPSPHRPPADRRLRATAARSRPQPRHRQPRRPGAKLLGLGDDVGVATNTERRHDIVAGALANDLECLRADRAGRTQHRHRGGHRRLS